MNNAAERIRRELMIRVIRDYYAGDLAGKIDHIPYELRPRAMQASRCCIYKDRAVLKYRLMALLGFGIEDETDESTPLCEYLALAEKREKPAGKVLTVIPAACHGCIESQYLVTNACRGCFARPCTFVCPRKAIEVKDQRAVIDRHKCIDCGKCVGVCPYHAIIRTPIPCVEACPVGALSKDETGAMTINFDRCVSCGQCFKACPFSAVMERSSLIDILQAVKSGRPVVALVAPAALGQFPGTLGQLFSAMKEAGFADIIEVALGAERTTAHEAEEFIARMGEGARLMTSSCCPAYVEAVRRHVPELLPMVSTTPSPMRFAAEIAREKHPDATMVFIGPCIAKRYEALITPEVDWVMTFEELGAWLAALNVDINAMPEYPLDRPAAEYARNFARSCGVTAALMENMDSPVKLEEKTISGLDRKTMTQLKLYAQGKMPGNFLEVMACQGGCVGGPCSLVEPRPPKK